MMLSELQTSDKTVGIKQSMKKIHCGAAKKVFIAKNAAPERKNEVLTACERSGVSYEWAETMEELGKACKIDVGAAVAVVY